MALTNVIIDTREPLPIQAKQFGGVPRLHQELVAGDLWALTDDDQMLIIERKTPSDLLGSIKDGRLFAQCSNIRKYSKWGYLMVTGALAHTLDGHVITDNRTTGWRWDDVQGALVSCQEMGVNVVYCQSDSHYEEAVIRLARRERSEEKVIIPRVESRVLTAAEQILESLPGIGSERRKLLLDRFGTVADALAWLTWLGSLEEIGTIGDGTKIKIREALGLNPESWLTVFYPAAAEYAAMVASDEGNTSIVGMLQASTTQHQAISD